MNLAALLFLIGTVLLAIASFGTQLGDIHMIPTGLTFLGAGLFVQATTWNRTLG